MIDERFYCDRCGGLIRAAGDGSGYRYRVTIQAVEIINRGYQTFASTWAKAPLTRDFCRTCMTDLELDRHRPRFGEYGMPPDSAYEPAPRIYPTPETPA